MDIRRFFVQKEDVLEDTAYLRGEQAYHAVKVLRYKVGYLLIVCNGDGYDYHCVITKIGDTEVVCRIEGKIINENESPLELTLYFAIIKTDKMDLCLQKATELGVKRIVPILTRNVQEKSFRTLRAEKIVLEACKQCERAVLPEVSEPISFNEAIQEANGVTIFAYEKEKDVHLLNVLPIRCQKASLFIGPEGGWDDIEVQTAREKGAHIVSLGKRILRAETAVLSAVSAIVMFTDSL